MFLFNAEQKFLINDSEFLVRRYVDKDNIEVENLSYKKIEIWSKNVLLEKWTTGDLVFKSQIIDDDKDKVKFSKEFNDFSLRDRLDAKNRHKILEPVISGEILPGETKNYIKSIGVSNGAFYKYKSKWDTYRDIRALLPNKRGPKTSRGKFDEIFKMTEKLMGEWYYKGPKYSEIQLIAELKQRIKDENEYRPGNPLPIIAKSSPENPNSTISQSTIRRYIKKLVDQYKLDKIQYGPVEAKLRKNGSSKEVQVSRPLERVEIDWTKADVMLVDPNTNKPKRPNMILAMDKYTGHPLGFHLSFEEVDSAALKQCLLHVIVPKMYLKKLYPRVKNKWVTYGIPEEIIVDNASVNDSFDFEEACLSLDIDTQFTGVASGNQKGMVERALRSLNSYYIHSLEGTTFSNTSEKGQYDSEGNACITLDTFRHMTHIALIDIMAQNRNENKGGSPVELWNNALEENPYLSQPLTQSILDLKIILMTGINSRQITNKGIVILGKTFFSDELMELKRNMEKEYGHSSNLRVRFDSNDMRSIYVYDDFKQRYIVAKPKEIQGIEMEMSRPIEYYDLQLALTLSKNPNVDVETESRGEAFRNIKELEILDIKASRKRTNSKKDESEIINSTMKGIAVAGIPNVELVQGDKGEIRLDVSMQDEQLDKNNFQQRGKAPGKNQTRRKKNQSKKENNNKKEATTVMPVDLDIGELEIYESSIIKVDYKDGK